MSLINRYANAKQKLLTDPAICEANRTLFAEFFEYEEYKLKRINAIAAPDDNSVKTLLDYISRFRTVNRWFENKSWRELTLEDIKRVYDAVEDGKILTQSGTPFKDRATYYRKILRSKPFEMAGKKELVRKAMQFQLPQPRDEVRFIREHTFRSLIQVVTKLEHRALLWLAWDIGENVSSLLRLRKGDFTRTANPYSSDPEYHVNLRREILKRSRTPRTEITNYRETVELLDSVLAELADDAILFAFGHRMATKALARAVRITGARCIPGGQNVSLKDLRSSMACDLLGKGWTTDEVNQRLGHRPSSREIDRYVNWLALGRQMPKRRLHDNSVESLSQELRESRDREKLMHERLRTMQSEIQELKTQHNRNNRIMLEQVRRIISGRQRAQAPAHERN